LFRRSIAGRTYHHIGRGLPDLSPQFGKSEIAYLDGILICDQYVEGFDVPMYDSGLMQASESCQNLTLVV
jgi:hypothetical protein